MNNKILAIIPIALVIQACSSNEHNLDMNEYDNGTETTVMILNINSEDNPLNQLDSKDGVILDDLTVKKMVEDLDINKMSYNTAFFDTDSKNSNYVDMNYTEVPYTVIDDSVKGMAEQVTKTLNVESGIVIKRMNDIFNIEIMDKYIDDADNMQIDSGEYFAKQVMIEDDFNYVYPFDKKDGTTDLYIISN